MSDQEGIKIGRVLQSGISGFSVGCRISEETAPRFGALVKTAVSEELQVYGNKGECKTCGKPIKQLVQAQRSSYYCPGCQS